MRGLAVPLCFLALVGVFAADPWPFRSPLTPVALVPRWAATTQPVRRPKLEPFIHLAGRRYDCQACHTKFVFPEDPPLGIHNNIVLAHGINDRCLNCHHTTNRNAFAGNRDDQIPYDQPQLLCAKCHGPVYRDWLNRSHGRTNGYWDERFGPIERRRCIECHDPHDPPFLPMSPAPPPRTPRMGEPHLATEQPAVVNPLRPRAHAQPATAPTRPPLTRRTEDLP